MITLTNIQKRFGGRLVLDIPTLTIRAEERYALLGANGSGKSTLMKILAGMLKPDAGAVNTALTCAETAYLPQSPYAFDLTVLQNVQLPLGSGRAARARALEALERVGLTRMAKARANRLSGGETQRMALARVLARPHRLLLLDEPTSATDIQANDLIERALLDYCAEYGCTLVVSSHAPSQARRLGTQAVLLGNGRIVEQGTVEDVLLGPQSALAKAFLRHWQV